MPKTIAGTLAALALVTLLAACRTQPPLPVLGEIPEFHLVAQDGRTFDRSTLDGNIWVADFIFTSCRGPCPLMTNRMRRIQKAVAEYPDVRLVSFSIDPETDTPPVMAEYARRYQADTSRWFFLTGDKPVLDRLGRDDFKLQSIDGTLNHSTRFVLLDRRSRIRAYYSSEEEGAIDRLLADLRRLRKEKS
ncbi:MAG TPA: SCO family protein [Bryobacteraceae bacterium]|nr:SCO family protein [Bryobacteraceae bacterium]